MASWRMHLRLMGAASASIASTAQALSLREPATLEDGKRRRRTVPLLQRPLQPGLLAASPIPARCEEVERASPSSSSSLACKKRVCCIGAGAAGLSCAKEMLERGFDVTVLEAREGVGGVWRVETTGKYVGVRIGQRATSSKYYLGFSDFPMADTAQDFPGNIEYVKYLDDYVDHFGIREHIRFGHRTTGIKRADDDTHWEVAVTDNRGRAHRLNFDAVAVCSGLHTTPDFPPRGGPLPPAGFKAQVLHSMSLKDAEPMLRNKRIVVAGGGETGVELAHVAASVGSGPALFALRRGITVIGSYLPLPLEGRTADSRTPPVDLNERRVVSLLPPSLKHFIFTRSGIFALREDHPGKYTASRLAASLASKAINFVTAPFLIAGSAAAETVSTLSQPLFWSFTKPDYSPPDGSVMSAKMAATVASLPPAEPPSVGPRRDIRQLREYMDRAADFYMRGFTVRHYKEVRSLLEQYSGARHGSNFFTKQDDIIYDILERKLTVRPGIAALEGTNTVVFDDGSRAEVDVVIWCSGYQPTLPFLDGALPNASGFLDGQALYKHVFHPTLPSSIAFLGFARPQIGAMPPIAELQARWFGALLSGQVSLPSPEAMAAEAEQDRCRFESEKIFSGRLRSSVDFAKYTADVAQRAGCYPDAGLNMLISDPSLWIAFWFGPVLPQSYRLADGGARGAAAREMLMEVYRTFLTRD